MSNCKRAFVLALKLASSAAVVTYASMLPAQETAPVAPAESATGAVDAGLSRIYVRIGRLGWDHEHAAEGRLLSGNVQLGASERAGELVFDAASFIADTQDSRHAFELPGTVHDSIREKVTRQIFSRSVLDADRFPQAVFQIQSALPTGVPQTDGSGEYRFDGQLMLHGMTRPLRIVVLVEAVNDMWRIRGEGKIKLTDFGIRPPEHRLGKTAENVDLESDLWVHR